VTSILILNVMIYFVCAFVRHTDGPYYELIKKAFSPKHPLLRHAEFSGAKVSIATLSFLQIILRS
jgi:hypothetical protein